MLVIYGVITGSSADIYQRSLGINVNLCWGSLLLIFGVVMLVLAWRGSKASPSDKPDA
jgi:hypothetical protein